MKLFNQIFNLPAVWILSLLTLSPSTSAVTPTDSGAQTCVIVLHGMGRTAYSTNKIAERLRGLGYTVWNRGYPSLSVPIERLSRQAIDPGLAYCREQSAQAIHFVTHSLGGILLRHYLQEQNTRESYSHKPNTQNLNTQDPNLLEPVSEENKIPELDKIVMLSPPNHGSEVIDNLKDNWLFRAVMGPAALQLGTDGFVRSLRAIPGTIGIITGDESSDPWFSGNIPGPDDGKVSVESAKLDEMQDFLVVPVGHTFIMNDDQVITQIEFFLNAGVFQRQPATESPLPGLSQQ